MGSEKNERRDNNGLRFISGMAHACMVYAYPLMILMIPILVLGNTILKIKEGNMTLKKLAAYWFPYIMGGVVLLGFVGYVSSVGWENVYFFQEHAIESSLSG